MKIAVYAQTYQDGYRDIIISLLQFAEVHQVQFVFEQQFYELICKDIELKADVFSNHLQLDTSFDLLISIGGDGTILRAATYVRDSQIPILGINAGRLGFLASIPKENISYYLDLVRKKEYTLSRRTVLGLETTILIPELEDINFALNEISINRKDTTSMIAIETYLNEEYLNVYWADGLIISTPTGSTGYSLSCGGPVLFSESNSLVITPIAPHNLNVRPIVIPENTQIRIKVTGREEHYLVSLDSRITTVNNQNELIISKKPFDINMVGFKEKSFINTLRKKLLWGEDKRN